MHRLYCIIGAPTVQNFKALLRMNAIDNYTITMKDADITENIFGPDVISLKVKTTRTKPNPARRDGI